VIVSNSAGTRDDPAGIEAESVSHHLGVPVLFHSKKKPSCEDVITRYFASLPAEYPPVEAIPSTTPLPPHPISTIPPSKLIIVGDRLLTDVLLANKLRALPIWTTSLWRRELMGIRAIEIGFLNLVLRFRRWRAKEKKSEEATEWSGFIKAAELERPRERTRLARAMSVVKSVAVAGWRGRKRGCAVLRQLFSHAQGRGDANSTVPPPGDVLRG